MTVWQKAIKLSKEIYLLTEKFPKEELYGPTSQMRRAGVSTPSNIAEGRSRNTKKDFAHFLKISLGSEAELETQIEICKQPPKIGSLNFSNVENLTSEVMKMLHGMIKSLLKPES